MTFEIDTGTGPDRPHAEAWGRIDACNVLMAGVADSLPAAAPQGAVDAATVAAILGELHSPRTLETVRRKLLMYWPAISALSETDPAGFDELIAAYVDLTTSLPADLSEAAARRKASAGNR